jgi:hypothetical protein
MIACFSDTVIAEWYLTMLGDKFIRQLYELSMKTKWFMQDGTPQHCALSVGHWLDENFTSR